MASSSSTILTNLLEDETAEWRETIQSFMDQKTTEFSAIMKSSIEKTISEKIGNFYNRSFDNDAILFDTNGTDIIKKTLAIFEQNKTNAYLTPDGRKGFQQQINECNNFVKTNGYKCFTMESSLYTGNGNNTNKMYIFKHFMISYSKLAQSDNIDRPVYCKHNLANDNLFTIKYFQFPSHGGFDGGLKVYNAHPEYFKQNCSDFESVCKREYELIKAKKVELQQLIDENQGKIDHYRGLEEQIRSVELEKLAIEEEKNKLKEGKELLLLAKRKIAVMKTDIEKERQQLEEEKTKQRDEQFDMEGFLKTE